MRASSAAFWVALYMGLTARPTLNLLSPIPGRYYLFPLFALAILGWAWKMFTIARGIEGVKSVSNNTTVRP